MTHSTNAFLLCLFLLIQSHIAYAFWPFDSDAATTEKIEKKMEGKELSVSTRYYARGPSYSAGQKWSESVFLSQLEKQNYRIRDGSQSLLTGDAKKIDIAECKSFIPAESLPIYQDQQITCWVWQTHKNESFLVTISETDNIVLGTFNGLPWKVSWHAALDPLIVAQFRGQEPIMQSDHKISDFPVNCLNAVMAIEDNDFLDHSGVSYTGLSRAFVKNIIKLRAAQGGSTITQQLVKNYFLTPEKTLKRKLKEFYLAIKLESEWTKDEILETYLNIIYMGQSGAFQVHGFGAASQVYFGKKIEDLTLPDCALLAAIINNPTQNNPWKKAEKALTRRNLVLSKMVGLNLISNDEFEIAKTSPLPVQQIAKASETAPYFFDAVRKEMSKLNIPIEGASIMTSLDLDAQARAQKALQNQITALEISRKNLQDNKEKGFRLEGLVLSSENATGLVNVVVGGQSYRQTQFNRALDSHRQIGSLIKPFVYLSALLYGYENVKDTNPLTIIKDERFEWKFDKKKWSPDNYEKAFNGEIPLYYGLAHSLNSATAALAEKVTLSKIIETAHKIGFTSKMDEMPSTSLGATEHFPLELLQSYQTLSTFGEYSPITFIEKIEDRDGKVVYEYSFKNESKIDPATTQVLVGMMQETLRSGTAKATKSLGWNQPSAGKTGTTSDNKDAWFAGFTPHQTTITWLGYDQSLSSKLTGASGPVPIWVQFMKGYDSTWPADDFKWTAAVEKRKVILFKSETESEFIFKK
ncbi:MAG: transglycosylase domain-containing protein [Pseudobdellovibrio sp.]